MCDIDSATAGSVAMADVFESGYCTEDIEAASIVVAANTVAMAEDAEEAAAVAAAVINVADGANVAAGANVATDGSCERANVSASAFNLPFADTNGIGDTEW